MRERSWSNCFIQAYNNKEKYISKNSYNPVNLHFASHCRKGLTSVRLLTDGLSSLNVKTQTILNSIIESCYFKLQINRDIGTPKFLQVAETGNKCNWYKTIILQ